MGFYWGRGSVDFALCWLIFRSWGLFFRFFDASEVILRFFDVFFRFFFDFWWSGEGFGKDFGRIFEGFSMLLAEFIEKSIFAKIVILPR